MMPGVDFGEFQDALAQAFDHIRLQQMLPRSSERELGRDYPARSNQTCRFPAATDGVINVNDNGTRVRYATNTDHGSSGSPCFNLDWEVVGLHHMGDPAWINPRFNEGVPIGVIQQRLVQRGAIAGSI
jgi:hypothetical protein